MKCYNVRPYLEKMAAGEIDGVLFRRLEEHLQICPGCRGEYQEMKQVLELWRQAPRDEPVPYFSPAWRQRVRQKAFEKEAGGRSFFSVFKTNTLIPALGVFAVLAVLGVFNIGNRFTPKLTIKPQITKYAPTMSSVIGIPLTARFGGGTRRNLTYHWTAEYGQFLSWNGKVVELGADVRTRESKVYWSVKFKDDREGSSFYIRLEVEDRKTGKVIARAILKLEKDEAGFFVVGI
ncbi:MAG: anti-sigma factor family protein [Bacteroidota bacterium]